LLTIDLKGSRKTLLAKDSPQLLYLLVNILSDGSAEVSRNPLNLCMVLDRSTSMKGRKLHSVKIATKNIFEELSSEDVFSLVTFSDRGELLWSATDERNNISFRSIVERINTSGGTEIFQGLQLGVEQLRRSSLDNFNNQLILLTDGHTYGDVDACLALARAAAADGITLNAFGLGAEWNDRFLDELAGLTGGDTVYLESASQVLRDLNNRIQGMGVTYARNLRLLNNMPDGVTLSTVFKVAPVAQPLSLNGTTIRLGSTRVGDPSTYLLEFSIEIGNVGKNISIPISIIGDIPSKKVSGHQAQSSYILSVSDDVKDLDPPEELLAAVQVLNFYRMNEQAWEDIDAGNFQRAQTRFNLLSSRLIEAGQPELAGQIRGESEKMTSPSEVTMEGRKKLKYGTRSLMTQTVRLSRDDDA